MISIEIGELVRVISINNPSFIFFKTNHIVMSDSPGHGCVRKYGFALDNHMFPQKINPGDRKIMFELFDVMTVLEFNRDKTRAKLLLPNGTAGWLNTAFVELIRS